MKRKLSSIPLFVLFSGINIKLNILKFCKVNLAIVFTVCFFSSINIVSAQPSGGPYGPVQQRYELPKVSGRIYYVAPDGNAEATGDKLAQPTTIETAITKVSSGDAIILRGGTYRTGNLIFNQGITIQPYADEQPILKGTYEATEWTDLNNGLWRTSWSHFFPAAPADWWRIERHGIETPFHRFNNDMVFVDGKFLQSKGWMGEVDENSYFIDYERGFVYIGTDPTDRLVEITAFDIALHRVIKDVNGKVSDRKGPVVKGITFTQYAYRAIEIDGTEPEGLADEADYGKDVVGTVFEHCTFSFCSRVAGYFRGDRMVIRHSKVHDTSMEGIYILASSDCLLEKNIFTRNNIEDITGYYPAAVKIFNQSHRVTCNDNLVIDLPNSNGIWYDVGNKDGVFTNNWVEGVGSVEGPGSSNRVWPSNNGFFFEISKGAICAGNVFVNCDHSILVLNSSDVQIYQNTFINSTVCIARDTRSAEGDHFGWHPSTGPGVEERYGHIFMNNLLTADNDYQRPLLLVWQPSVLCDRLNKTPFSQMDNNVYVTSTVSKFKTLAYWSPFNNEQCQTAIDSKEGMQKVTGGSANSMILESYNLPLFKSITLGNFQLLPAFPGNKAAGKLPDNISKMLRIKGTPYIGAYPATR